jgi:hypothetical protein
MSGTLVKTEALAVDNQNVEVRFFELLTPTGARRYCADITIGPGDHIILDGDSVITLETKAWRLVPATLLSRTLARATAA